MCGAAPSPLRESGGTRQKRKSKVVACAERLVRWFKRRLAHAKKEKARLWRVRNGSFTGSREGWHTPKGKSKDVACGERLVRWFKRSLAHAKKEKQGCGVCGAAPLPLREGVGTR